MLPQMDAIVPHESNLIFQGINRLHVFFLVFFQDCECFLGIIPVKVKCKYMVTEQHMIAKFMLHSVLLKKYTSHVKGS